MYYYFYFFSLSLKDSRLLSSSSSQENDVCCFSFFMSPFFFFTRFLMETVLPTTRVLCRALWSYKPQGGDSWMTCPGAHWIHRDPANELGFLFFFFVFVLIIIIIFLFFPFSEFQIIVGISIRVGRKRRKRRVSNAVWLEKGKEWHLFSLRTVCNRAQRSVPRSRYYTGIFWVYAAVEPLKFMTKTSIKMFEGHGRKRKGYNNAY